MNICGQCEYYVLRPFSENVCGKSGKIVPYMQKKECFKQKTTTIINKQDKQMETQETITMKVCPECGRELPVEQFGHHARTKDGYQPMCKECAGNKKRGRKCPRKNKVQAECQEEKVEMSYVAKCDCGIEQITDVELVTELRRRGYEVRCTKTIEL